MATIREFTFNLVLVYKEKNGLELPGVEIPEDVTRRIVDETLCMLDSRIRAAIGMENHKTTVEFREAC